jgi:hypothetical protein
MKVTIGKEISEGKHCMKEEAHVNYVISGVSRRG